MLRHRHSQVRINTNIYTRKLSEPGKDSKKGGEKKKRLKVTNRWTEREKDKETQKDTTSKVLR